MTRVTADILKLASRASLNITSGEKSLMIRQKLNLRDKAQWGVALILLGGLFMLYLAFTRISDGTDKMITLAIGTLLSLGSVIILIKQAREYVHVNGDTISFSFNLRLTTIAANKVMKIEMDNETIRGRHKNFILITLFVHTADEKKRLLNYTMETKNTADAIKLGNAIKQLLNEHVRQAQRIIMV